MDASYLSFFNIDIEAPIIEKVRPPPQKLTLESPITTYGSRRRRTDAIMPKSFPPKQESNAVRT